MDSGDWNNDFIYDGEVQITMPLRGSGINLMRLLAKECPIPVVLADLVFRFPDLKIPRGGTHLWGPFPQVSVYALVTRYYEPIQFSDNFYVPGNTFTIKLAHAVPRLDFTCGFLVDGQLSPSKYQVDNRRNGRNVVTAGGDEWEDSWTDWSHDIKWLPVDQVDVTITEGSSVGLLVLEYLAWEVAKPKGIAESAP